MIVALYALPTQIIKWILMGNGLLSEAVSCPKPDNIDSDKSPLRTIDLESYIFVASLSCSFLSSSPFSLFITYILQKKHVII